MLARIIEQKFQPDGVEGYTGLGNSFTDLVIHTTTASPAN